jgi:hypothetical protein
MDDLGMDNDHCGAAQTTGLRAHGSWLKHEPRRRRALFSDGRRRDESTHQGAAQKVI